MANVYTELIRLLPSTETIVGKIASVNATENTASISSLVGGVFTVNVGKGTTYAVNDWVLIKDKIIVSTIPVPQGDTTPEVAKPIEIY